MMAGDDHVVPFEDEVTELSVLVSGQQALDLEQAAYERGLTTAQMLRVLIRDFLQRGQGNTCTAGALQQWA